MDEDEKFRKQVIARLDRIESKQEAARYLTASLFAAGAGFTVFNFTVNNREDLLFLILGLFVGFFCMGIASYFLGRYEKSG